jgi:caa(3)-type oxidase subunit IV
MSDHEHSHEHTGQGGHGGQAHAHPGMSYEKTFVTLLVLLGISIIGPEIGIKWLTLVTAFGIAVVKAYLVASNFMHLNVEKRYVAYLLLTALALMTLFYAGVAPDVMNHRGRGWENVAAQGEVERALEATKSAGAAHGADHH